MTVSAYLQYRPAVPIATQQTHDSLLIDSSVCLAAGANVDDNGVHATLGTSDADTNSLYEQGIHTRLAEQTAMPLISFCGGPPESSRKQQTLYSTAESCLPVLKLWRFLQEFQARV